jgi:hypothetical protein
MAAGLSHPSFRQTSPHSRLRGAAQRVRLFGIRASHAFATQANTSWIADHVDANTAQTLATRAYHAANRVCVGKARRVRFRSKGRGLDSLEGKTNTQGIRFVLQPPHKGNQGWLVWGEARISARIDWQDPVVLSGLLRHRRIKYVWLLRRKASSPRAKGADRDGFRSSAQLALEGVPYQKPTRPAGAGRVGLDLGPSTIAVVPKLGEARLGLFCAALAPRIATKRRLQRKLDRKLRANNPQHDDEQGRCKQGRKTWQNSQGYQTTRRRLAHQERKLAAQRKSLHGQMAHEIVAMGDTIITEKISYRAWQHQFGRSVGLRAPGMFIEILVSHRCKHGRHPGRASPPSAPGSRSIVMAVVPTSRNRSRSAGMCVPAALGQCSVTCTRRFWPLICISRPSFPLLPRTSVYDFGSPAGPVSS